MKVIGIPQSVNCQPKQSCKANAKLVANRIANR